MRKGGKLGPEGGKRGGGESTEGKAGGETTHYTHPKKRK